MDDEENVLKRMGCYGFDIARLILCGLRLSLLTLLALLLCGLRRLKQIRDRVGVEEVVSVLGGVVGMVDADKKISC